MLLDPTLNQNLLEYVARSYQFLVILQVLYDRAKKMIIFRWSVSLKGHLSAL